MQLLPLPGMIGERLFSIWDSDHDLALNLEDYVSLVAILTKGTEEERYHLLYDVRAHSSTRARATGPGQTPDADQRRRTQMFNVEEDGGISKEELVIMFNSMHPEDDSGPSSPGVRRRIVPRPRAAPAPAQPAGRPPLARTCLRNWPTGTRWKRRSAPRRSTTSWTT